VLSIFNLHTSSQAAVLPPDWPGNFWFHMLVFIAILFIFVILGVMAFIYIERRILGRFQIRIGPNRTGPFGIIQPVADTIKILIKEDIIPHNADGLLHLLAPAIAFIPVLLIFAVIPLQNGVVLVDLNIGILYIVAISSVGTVGILMAGWASNNKYGLLGAMRVIAEVVSYEIPLALSIIGIVLLTGSLSMSSIVASQNIPFILLQPLGFIIYFVAALAEINRTPFDLLDAESEIVAGFNIEYSGIKFALFYLTEYSEALAISAIISTIYLGGWRGPLLPPVLWLLIKMLAVFIVIIWVRSTLPRIRIDHVMAFAWKCLLPLALINLLITGIQVITLSDISQWVIVAINFVVAAVLILVWSRFYRLTGNELSGDKIEV
jgi:NADH-quinone oxidoreductase subunit H